MAELFTGMYALLTLGSFLRCSAFGHVRQLDTVAARLVANLAARTPLLRDADQIAYLASTTPSARPTASRSRTAITATPV
jgi:hypothetical protein